MPQTPKIVAVIPAAGVGKRMQTHCPKQYLSIANKTILQHTVDKLASHPSISSIVISVSKSDQYFASTQLAEHPKVSVAKGGKERVDSVLNGLCAIEEQTVDWVIVHDAARPCITHQDIDLLIEQCLLQQTGGLLAIPVRDTMKRSYVEDKTAFVKKTVAREHLWHALTPQMYPAKLLKKAIEQALIDGKAVTDEASAIELAGGSSLLVQGRADNIKITQPDDLAMAEFILLKQQDYSCE
ncbi:2-C-methyl-D-erythritol 4-phosphate cytidylyltransferase [Thalassotalea sp. 1_MG-2023]|uniref:2-C-methyl-D-erythritol 4-phosphate cytidylyltransferase n=1 Tax=Thalassotalea sp. 1_MG-2023 TaxID=3062680 RepID=UPI0026E36A08|nr:2-C-methyl-D-erythritol 4-phosphate cytidylyltransferase [Thalassotalea sp. 1_MG-2023]MDO6428117.1 2-C-methyl-D-erythritol 4-phosphate cytidylyltransferase [Thalassotalea sp. 1_MG-2023]